MDTAPTPAPTTITSIDGAVSFSFRVIVIEKEATSDGAPLTLPYAKVIEVVAASKPFEHLRLRPAAESMAETPPIVPWLVEGLLPDRALSVLSAYAKAGKTTWLRSLYLHMLRGIPFLGFPTTATRIAVLYEDPPEVFNHGLTVAGATETDLRALHLQSLRYKPLPFTGPVFAELARYARGEGIGLVVVDTISKFWDVNDESNTAAVRDALHRFHGLIVDMNAGVLVVHHANKSEGGGIRSLRGASTFADEVDHILLLDRLSGGAKTRRRLSALGRYGEQELVMEWHSGMDYRLIGAPAQIAHDSADAADCAVMKVILTTEWQTRQALIAGGQSKGISKERAAKVLSALVDSGEAERDGPGTSSHPHHFRLVAGWNDPA